LQPRLQNGFSSAPVVCRKSGRTSRFTVGSLLASRIVPPIRRVSSATQSGRASIRRRTASVHDIGFAGSGGEGVRGGAVPRRPAPTASGELASGS